MANGRCIATETTILDPEGIILGGGVILQEGFPRKNWKRQYGTLPVNPILRRIWILFILRNPRKMALSERDCLRTTS
jgi:hypothetical protein